MALVMVYVGAVMVLFLFVVMMLDINIERLRAGLLEQPLRWAFWSADCWCRNGGGAVRSLASAWPTMPPQNLPANYSNTKELGVVIFTDYVYPFEIASVILLVAIIAAVMLTCAAQGQQGDAFLRADRRQGARIACALSRWLPRSMPARRRKEKRHARSRIT
jgi:NADH:ubiquinone oxidoreductase subunit 6 (subunit J)